MLCYELCRCEGRCHGQARHPIKFLCGEEKVHVMERAAPLLMASAPDASDAGLSGMAAPNHVPAIDLGQRFSELWNDLQVWEFTYIGGGIYTAKSETHGFYGPFATVSVGIGG
jgi:hypothetical protein